MLFIDFKVDDGRLSAVERTQGLRATCALMVGLQFVVDVGIQAMEMIRAILLRDEGPDLKSLRVFQLHDGAFQRQYPCCH